MKASLLLYALPATVIASLAGCAAPAVTGGDVTFHVYMARPSESTLLSYDWEVHSVKKALIMRSLPIARCVVIPQYETPGEPLCFPAQVATSEKNVVTYPGRLQLATWDGREHLAWQISPKGRSFMYAWVFAEGAWPVYARESTSGRYLMTGDIRTRWGGWTDVASSLEGEATIVCFPLSRPWDREVAAGAGCRMFTYFMKSGPKVPAHVGVLETLYTLSAVPCTFIGAVEQSKSLTDADRLMVYRHVLRIYKETKAEWMSGEPTGYRESSQKAYEKNVALLRERIKDLEAKAPPFTGPAGK